MKNCLALALAALTLTSCSLGEKFGRLKAEEGMTIVQFAKARSLAAATGTRMAGGVMVYALRKDGYTASFKLQDETDSREVSLPNGEYTFRAVGWAGTNLTGATQCGLGQPAGGAPGGAFKLSGASTTVAIALSPAGCNSDDFSSASLRTASGFVNPSVVFCNEDAAIAGRSPGAACTNGDESLRFLKGIASASAAKIEDVEFFAGKNRFVFSADLHNRNRLELFSTDLNGKNLIRQNLKIAASADQVKKVAAVPGTNYLIYLAPDTSSGIDTLFVSEVGSSRAWRLLNANPNTAVKSFTVTKHGAYIVFAADLGGTAGAYSLYSFPLNATTLAAPNTNALVKNLSGSNTLKISGPDVIYAVSHNDSSGGIPQVLFPTGTPQNDLYVNSLDGTLTALKLSTSTTNPNATITDVFFIGSSKAMGFIGDITGSRKAYYSVLAPLNIVANPVVMSTLDPDSVVSVSTHSPAVVYSRDADGKSKLFSLTFDPVTNVPTAGGEVMIAETPVLNATYGGIQFHPDGQRITFWSNASDTTKHEVYSGVLNSPAILRGHSAPGVSMSIFDPEKAVQFGGANELFYLSSVNSSPTAGDVYRVDTSDTTPRNAALVSTNEPGDLAQMVLQAFPGHAFYTKLVAGGDPYYELHHYNAGSVASRRLPLPVQNITKLHAPPAEWPGIPGFPAPLFFEAQSAGSTGGPSDLFVLDNRLAASPRMTKLTHLFDSSQGYGRFRFTMLPYRREAGGALVPNGEGISSSCLGLANRADEPATALPISFPYGNGPSPFVVVLELFPEQLDCSGTPVRHRLDGGLNTLTNAPASSKAALSVSSTPAAAVLFLRD